MNVLACVVHKQTYEGCKYEWNVCGTRHICDRQIDHSGPRAGVYTND